MISDSPLVADAAAVRELCHEIRQPIAALSALVDLVVQEPDLPRRAQLQVDKIAGQVSYLRELSQVLLHQLDERLAFDIGELVRDVVDICSLCCPASVEFDGGELTDERLVVVGSPVGVRRALVNLVENAGKAAGFGGRVLVSARPVGGEAGPVVRIDVEDDGPGFGGAVSSGSLLGLEIVTRIARTHGGAVELATSPMGGALARLTLPLEA